MRRPNHGCASAVKTKTSPEPPETLAPQFDYWAPKSRISAAFTLTKAPKSGSWVRPNFRGFDVCAAGEAQKCWGFRGRCRFVVLKRREALCEPWEFDLIPW